MHLDRKPNYIHDIIAPREVKIMSGIMINWDDSAYYVFIHGGYLDKSATKEEAYQKTVDVIQQYANTGVTDFVMCVNGRVSSYPSKTIEHYGDLYHSKKQNGIDIDFTNTWISSYHRLFEVYGLDFFQIWLDELKKIGVKRWLSVRMNDAHETLSDTSILAPHFFYENPQFRRVLHRKPRVTFDSIFDYSHAEIRKRYLDYIDETLERYDSDGLELDWLREIFCFKPGEEYKGLEIMTNFMRDVKKLVEKYEKIRGHKIDISVRMPASIEVAFNLGFDVINWAKEGLINLVVVSPRWSTTDTDLPIELWKRFLEPYNVLVAGGIEVILRQNRSNVMTLNSRPTIAANATNIYSAGADRFYMFNYMYVPNFFYTPDVNDDFRRLYSEYNEILNECGSLETTAKATRRHFITFRDLLPDWNKTEYFVPAELKYDNGATTFFRIRTGKVLSDSKAYLVLGMESDDNSRINDDQIVIYVNSVEQRGLKHSKEEDHYIKNDIYVMDIRDSSILNDTNVIEIGTRGRRIVVKHLEIRIDKKDD